MKNCIPMLGLVLCFALISMTGCDEKNDPNPPASSAGAATTAAPPVETPPLAPVEITPPPAYTQEDQDTEAARARRAAKEAAGDAADAFKGAAGLTFDEAKAAAQVKASAAQDDLKEFGEKADAAVQKAGVKAGSALQDAAEKTDAALQKAAQKADVGLREAAEKADGKLSDLASKASEALGLNEPAPPAEGRPSGLTESFLVNQKFLLKKINEADFKEVEGQPRPTIEFSEGFMVTGRVCNNFRGPGQLENGRLTVRAMSSTRMACVDDVLGPLEGRLFSMLESGADISMNGSFLTIRQGDTSLIYQADTGR